MNGHSMSPMILSVPYCHGGEHSSRQTDRQDAGDAAESLHPDPRAAGRARPRAWPEHLKLLSHLSGAVPPTRPHFLTVPNPGDQALTSMSLGAILIKPHISVHHRADQCFLALLGLCISRVSRVTECIERTIICYI